MAVATKDYAGWLDQADIPLQRRTPQLDVLLEAVYRFRQEQGDDYYSTRLLSHFLLHCDCGLKVAQIARLVGIARPTASKQQGMSSQAAIHQAHHRRKGRPHGKLLPRYAGPIAAFLLSHPKASQADLIAFVGQTFDVQVSRIALYKFRKKYGLHDVGGPTQTVQPGSPAADDSAASPGPTPGAAAQEADVSTARPAESPSATTLSPPVAAAATVVSAPVPLLSATLIETPAPVIELARAFASTEPSAPPFSSERHNTPAPSC